MSQREPSTRTVQLRPRACSRASRKIRPVKISADVPYMGQLIDLTANITATEPDPATGRSQSRSQAAPARRGPTAAAMTNHIQNSPICAPRPKTPSAQTTAITAVLWRRHYPSAVYRLGTRMVIAQFSRRFAEVVTRVPRRSGAPSAASAAAPSGPASPGARSGRLGETRPCRLRLPSSGR